MAIDLLKSFTLHTAHVELTSACNLRCIYCPVSQPGYNAETMSSGLIVESIFGLLQSNLKEVNINGHGETTIVKGWDKIFKPLLESPINCNLISNLSKNYSDNEIEALARLHVLTISCDTFDPKTYQELRRNGSLVNILVTIQRIRLKCSELGIRVPHIGFSCVLGADNAIQLSDFINTSRQLKVDFLQFCDLTEYPAPPDADYTLKPLTDLTEKELSYVEKNLKDAISTNSPRIGIQDGIFRKLHSTES